MQCLILESNFTDKIPGLPHGLGGCIWFVFMLYCWGVCRSFVNLTHLNLLPTSTTVGLCGSTTNQTMPT